MSANDAVFHFDSDRPSFEDQAEGNGATHWTEAVLMRALGYDDRNSFARVILRAKRACLTAGLHSEEHFILQSDGTHLLTRFGCYLVAMNGTSAKPQVAAAQVYFAKLAQTFQTCLEHADGLDRMLIREELSDGHRSLASTAKRHGVENYAFFQNKGYMGLYNMGLKALCDLKGIRGNSSGSGAKLMDMMGKAELAANLFRVTQTDERVKNQNIHGQRALEDAAFNVGREVRNLMIRNGSSAPENLPLAEDIKEVKRKIKGTKKTLARIPGKTSRHNDQQAPTGGDPVPNE
jgi:DNA-damage-inducible protein D